MGMNILATSNEIQKESEIFKLAFHSCQSTPNSETNTEENQYEDEDSTVLWVRDVPQWIECLPGRYEVLASIPTPHTTRLGEKVCNSSTSSI